MHLDKELIYPAVAVCCATVAAVFDVRTRKIPNRLTGTALVLRLLLHFAFDGWNGVLSASTAALVSGVIFFLFYLAGGMGGGDVKLIASVACIAGLSNMVILLVFTSLAGGALALVFAIRQQRLQQMLFNVVELGRHHFNKGLQPHPDLHVQNAGTLRLPYGVAIAVGTLLTLHLPGIQR